MSLLSALAMLVTLVVWVIEMVLFGIARHRSRDRGVDATWGNANWLVLGALVAACGTAVYIELGTVRRALVLSPGRH